MDETSVVDVSESNLDDLCRVCVPAGKMQDPDWARGVAEKKAWAAEMLDRWGSFAKIAYLDDDPVGMIQYRPVLEERVVAIDCIYVPPGKSMRKGVASRLFASLMADVNRPMIWFDNRPPLALVVNTFEGGSHDQYTAREFFTRKGFIQIGRDPDDLVYPLETGYVYQHVEEKVAVYVPQEEDRGRAILVCGPNMCPATYPFFSKKMERYIQQVCPEVPIAWLDAAREPEEARKRRVGPGDCIVNARRIDTCVLDKEGFQREVKAALGQQETPESA